MVVPRCLPKSQNFRNLSKSMLSTSCTGDDEGVRFMKNPSVASLRRGTGGRSSFNGVVATVFGNSGFLGSYVCNKLGKVGTQLILPYRGDWSEMRRLKLVGDLGQVIFKHFHLKDENSIAECVKYSNVVINLIGREYETKTFTFNCVHSHGAGVLARIAKRSGVEKFIHVSALNAEEDPTPYFIAEGSNFLKSKRSGEEAVRKEFPEATIFRPSDIYGQGDRFTQYFTSNWRHNMKWMPLYKKGEETEKQPVFAGDVAAGILQACIDKNAAGKTYQAVGPRRYLLADLVDWFHRIINKTDEWGYTRVELQNDPIMKGKISILPMLTLGWPKGNLHWEKVELECHSDSIDNSVDTLEDLSVPLTKMEDQVPWELRPNRAWPSSFKEASYLQEAAPPNTISTT